MALRIGPGAMVAAAFIGPKPEGLLVLHGPGGVSDNTPQNLYYGDHTQNEKDKERDGTKVRGTNHPNTGLTEEQVLEIYNYPKRGNFRTVLKQRYGVSTTQISRIRRGESWSWLTSKP